MSAKAKFFFTIQTTSGVPIYRQIIDQIKTHLATGTLQPETFLPSVRQVAQELEINPMTVSKAYSLLEKEGVLDFVRGQGMRLKKSPLPAKELKSKEAAMSPLLREVVTRADQLSITQPTVLRLLDEIWEEEDRG